MKLPYLIRSWVLHLFSSQALPHPSRSGSNHRMARHIWTGRRTQAPSDVAQDYDESTLHDCTSVAGSPVHQCYRRDACSPWTHHRRSLCPRSTPAFPRQSWWRSCPVRWTSGPRTGARAGGRCHSLHEEEQKVTRWRWVDKPFENMRSDEQTFGEANVGQRSRQGPNGIALIQEWFKQLELVIFGRTSGCWTWNSCWHGEGTVCNTEKSWMKMMLLWLTRQHGVQNNTLLWLRLCSYCFESWGSARMHGTKFGVRILTETENSIYSCLKSNVTSSDKLIDDGLNHVLPNVGNLC